MAGLLERPEKILLPNIPVLPFDARASYKYGDIRAEIEQKGRPVGDADLRIASIALVRGLTVVTGNARHFNRVTGLKVENWLEW